MTLRINPSPPSPPVGRCIYCGTTRGRLTREHVIPKMLGGNMTLPKASCDDCANITKRFEQHVGRRIFHDVRLKHGFRITERPSHLPVLESFEPSPESAPARLVPTKNAPGILSLLVPEPPGILTGRAEGSQVRSEFFFAQISDGMNDTEEVRRQLGVPGLIYREFQPALFGRFLAKVALGIGVQSCGVDGFNSQLGDVIIRGDRDPFHWVGGTTAEMSEMPDPTSGMVLHRVVAFGEEIGNIAHLVVQLQLLTYLATPIYTVVLGELFDEGADRLNQCTLRRLRDRLI